MDDIGELNGLIIAYIDFKINYNYSKRVRLSPKTNTFSSLTAMLF